MRRQSTGINTSAFEAELAKNDRTSKMNRSFIEKANYVNEVQNVQHFRKPLKTV